MKILDSKVIADKMMNELINEISSLEVKPELKIILIGHDEPSERYVAKKIEAAENIGISIELIRFETIHQEDLLNLIKKLNNDANTHGIIVQFPLPLDIDPRTIRNAISPNKDVDGLNIKNQLKLEQGKKTLVSPTALGVVKILNHHKITVKNENIVVIGEGRISGWPTAILLKQMGANVTSLNKDNFNEEIIKSSNIVISCAGQANIITENNIKKDSIVINVGMQNGRGDVDFESISTKAAAASPIIGGTGPLTVLFLLKNLLDCYKIKI